MIDIGRFVDDALSGREAAESRGLHVPIDHLPIFGLYKDTALALRYRPRSDVVSVNQCFG